MSTRSILVNFNGYPSTIDSLAPDSGLASLAGSLLGSGHETLIMDFSSVDIIKRLVPDDISRELNGVYEKFLMDMQSSGRPTDETLEYLVHIDGVLESHKQERLDAIADEIVDEANNSGADFIGFKLWTGDGFVGSARMAKRVRESIPHVKLFAGGPHVDWFMESVFGYTDVFDALAYGEGEETIKFLADYASGKRKLSEIPNIIYRQNGEIKTTKMERISDLDSLPDPIYDDRIYPAMKGDQKIKLMMIDESRGCPNACHFCIHPNKSGSGWRKRDPVKTVALMEALTRQLNTNTFRLAGSNTPATLKKELAREIIRRGLTVKYSAFGHVRESEKDDYELLRKSGCISLAFGIESGSQRILDQDINKKVKVSQISSALKECKRSGILVVASIIVPCPHDDSQTIKETLELLTEARPDSVTVQLPGLIPNTYWYENRDSFGFELDDDYINKLMTYRIKLLLPPILWEPMPYKINGRTNHQSAVLAQDMARELEKRGIYTGVADFLLLIGANIGLSIKELRDKNRRLFFTGNHREIHEMVKLFNERVTRA